MYYHEKQKQLEKLEAEYNQADIKWNDAHLAKDEDDAAAMWAERVYQLGEQIDELKAEILKAKMHRVEDAACILLAGAISPLLISSTISKFSLLIGLDCKYHSSIYEKVRYRLKNNL